MMKSTLIKDLYGEIDRLKAGEMLFVSGENAWKQVIVLCNA